MVDRWALAMSSSCSLSPASLVWDVGRQEHSPPERGRLGRMLDMKSLPALGLNIVENRYRGDVYIADCWPDTIGTAQCMFAGWRQALYWRNVFSLSLTLSLRLQVALHFFPFVAQYLAVTCRDMCVPLLSAVWRRKPLGGWALPRPPLKPRRVHRLSSRSREHSSTLSDVNPRPHMCKSSADLRAGVSGYLCRMNSDSFRFGVYPMHQWAKQDSSETTFNQRGNIRNI